jgi:hypothetical protein
MKRRTAVHQHCWDLSGSGTVWYDPHSIAHILSPKRGASKCRVEFDSEAGGIFIVTKPYGTVFEFSESEGEYMKLHYSTGALECGLEPIKTSYDPGSDVADSLLPLTSLTSPELALELAVVGTVLNIGILTLINNTILYLVSPFTCEPGTVANTGRCECALFNVI